MRFFFKIAISILLCFSSAAAGPLEAPLPSNSKILRSSTFVVGPNGSSSNLFIPARGVLAVDYLVEEGKEIRLGILTNAQYQQVVTGHKMTGPVLMNILIKGPGSQSIKLERGTYAVVFIQNGSQNTRLSYRASYRPGP